MILLVGEQKLEILDLHSNNIGNQGALALADILTHSNTTLTDRSILAKEQGCFEIKALKRMVKTKTTQFLSYSFQRNNHINLNRFVVSYINIPGTCIQ